MALDLPDSALEVVERAKTDVQLSLPASNPFLPNSWPGALVTGYANRVFDFYLQLDILQNVLLPDRAVDEFLERWAAIYGLQRLAATISSGNIIATGTIGGAINIGTVYVSSDGLLYTSTASVVVANTITNISSLTRSALIVTAVTSTPHELANNVQVTITGAVETGYNGTFAINVVDEVTFTYEIVVTPPTPATGTITASYDTATVPIDSDDFQNSEEGINVNQDSGASLTLQSPIVNVDNVATVGAVPIGGGTDQETNDQLRTRLLERIQNPVAQFNSAAIVQKAKEVPGVTRVFVFEITPAVGQVTIYFMRDNDSNPIPDAGEVTTVKNKILEIKPVNTADIDVIVNAPTPVIINFNFTTLNPNTPSMQSAVTANLQQFFAEETEVGEDIQEDEYRCAIQNTIDTETGDRINSFTLSTPTGNITINTGEIGVLGTVTYP